MRALVMTKEQTSFLELRNVKKPKIESGDVLIKVKAAPIGAGDYHVIKCDHSALAKILPPVILGLENSGEIVEVGENVRGWQIGDRVVSEPIVSVCRKCFYCRTGNHAMCPQGLWLGRGVDGAMAEYFRTPADCLHKIPEEVTYDEAAVSEDLACVVNALVQRTKIQAGDVVAILGPGSIGLLSCQVAKIGGASKVVVTGRTSDEARLRLAEKLGADVSVDVDQEDASEVIKELTDGLGADVVIEASGSTSAINEAFDLVRKGGKIGVIGITPTTEPISVPWHKVVDKLLSVTGHTGYEWTSWELALNMLSTKRVDSAPLVTHKFPLEEWKRALRAMEKKEAIKPLLIPEMV